MRTGRTVPLAIQLQAQGVRDLQLLGQVPGHLRRHLPRVRHEPAQEPHARQLDREPEPVVGPALGLHSLPVRVVQEEVPLQLRPQGHLVKRPVLGRLLIRQELDRHNSSPKIDNNDPRKLRRSITPGQRANQPGDGLAHDLTRMFLRPREADTRNLGPCPRHLWRTSTTN